MNRLIYYFITIWECTKQLFIDDRNNYWVIGEKDYDRFIEQEQKIIEIEKENKTYKSLCKKLIRKTQDQMALIDILSEDKENN